MATSTFSKFYKARVVKTIVGNECLLYALGFTSSGKSHTGNVTSAHLKAAPSSTSLSSLADPETIPFAGIPAKVDSTEVVEIKNTGIGGPLTIPAGSYVHKVALAHGTTTTPKLRAWINLTNPDSQYYYEEQGTLTIPVNGYTVKHN